MPNQSRQLAAIMFTDIVGYTSLMGKDSAKALELVRISKEIQKPLVEKHKGKWLKEMGDGALVQFNSALDAVICALEIQEIARGKFDGKLRIGIHSGDITIEKDDVYGDGVNVAARLESITDPGGIYVSESIEKAIRGQSNIQAKYLGEIRLKNVDYGVRTYALQGIGLPVPDLRDDKNLSGRFIAELQRRGVFRAGATYIVLSLLLILLVPYAQSRVDLPKWLSTILYTILIGGFPLAMYFAWIAKRNPLQVTLSSQQWLL
jgi:class 3 adenylate cyclase